MHIPNTKEQTPALTRRGLFRSLSGAPVAEVLRPPWSLRERAFQAACDGCGACVRACAPGVLRSASGYPEAGFTTAGCDGCGGCERACTTGALDAATQPMWRHTVTIGPDCLASEGVVCRVCGEQCEAGAIRFRLAVGGRARPELDLAACTGCGACVAPCPVTAITITALAATPA